MKRGASSITNALIWRWILIILGLVFIGLAGLVWFSGRQETLDAVDNGRRLLIRLDTGAIEGKQVTTMPESPEANSAPDNKSADTATAPATAEAPKTASPVAGAVSAESAAPVVELAPVKLATVPLADIRPNLSEKSDAGPLPVIGPDGVKPWHYYSKPYTRKGNLPMIAVVITGLGQNKTATDAALRLPENISLSFSPYAKDLSTWTKAARTAGHEIMLDLPLEPSNYPASDPGPHGLLTTKGKEENAGHLKWLMSRVEGYVGFTTPQNEVYSANNDTFKTLLESLSTRGLMLVVGHDPAGDATRQILNATTTANVIADVLVDEELSTSAIQTRLALLEETAKKRGYAIGITQPFPLTMQQLNSWTAQLQKDGFVLVPVTFIANLKFSS